MKTEAGDGGAISILIVEDNPDHATLARAAFQEHQNWKIDVAGSLASAYSMITGNGYDIILVDYVLPDGSGLDLLDWVRKECAVVVMTSQGSEKVAVESFRTGALNYVIKDALFRHNLLVAVEQIINGKHSTASGTVH